MGIMEIIKRRHSVRQYTDQPIELENHFVLENLVKNIN